ncbi:MAG: YihA family ribosome biogenesis GTP-binding protein [Candidatus Sericytochromatia bacterium]|nr:YihA family ribosome biogenesis GTP-binding protein [Candidatus Sericytochromatia bacterium]
MKIISSEFITSATSKKGYPKRVLSEIAILGRSNVGKSSLINSILNKRGLAKTSSTPGKTRLINYFLINDNFYLVDLPGYGYAKVSKSEQESWKVFIDDYLKSNPNLKLLLLLIDIRHEFKDIDKTMIEFLNYYSVPYAVLLTKSDKLNQSDRKNQFEYYKNLIPDVELVVTSAEKGLGKDQVLRALDPYLKMKTESIKIQLTDDESQLIDEDEEI